MNANTLYKKSSFWFISLLLMALPLLVSCESGTIMKDDSPQALSSSQINWASWNADTRQALNSLERAGGARKWIIADEGGTVGGPATFDNMVEIPAGALSEDSGIYVIVVDFDDDEQTGPGVDFLPSQTFNSDVLVTLSYAYLECDEEDDCDLNDFIVYFSQDQGDSWYELIDPIIDENNQTISVWVDHFTRFGWGIGGEEPIGD